MDETTVSLKIWPPEDCNYSGNNRHSVLRKSAENRLSFYYRQPLSFAQGPENILEIEHAKGMQKYIHCSKTLFSLRKIIYIS